MLIFMLAVYDAVEIFWITRTINYETFKLLTSGVKEPEDPNQKLEIMKEEGKSKMYEDPDQEIVILKPTKKLKKKRKKSKRSKSKKK